MIFRKVPRGGAIQTVAHKMDVIVSEHYGGRNITSADHLERFYFAPDLGLIRWQRWENFALARLPDIHQMGKPTLPYSAPHHQMADDRLPQLDNVHRGGGQLVCREVPVVRPDMLGL
jgi:hypothetical protein